VEDGLLETRRTRQTSPSVDKPIGGAKATLVERGTGEAMLMVALFAQVADGSTALKAFTRREKPIGTALFRGVRSKRARRRSAFFFVALPVALVCARLSAS